MQPALSLTAAVLLGYPALPQGHVIVVDETGGGDFTALAPALAAVSDGDTVLIKPGDYGALTVNGTSLTVQADPSANVDRITVAGLAPGQGVVVRGLNGFGIDVSNCAGSVWFEDCVVNEELASTGPLDPAVAIQDSASVVLSDITATGDRAFCVFFCSTLPTPTAGGTGIFVEDSFVTLLESNVTGGTGSKWCFTSSFCGIINGGTGIESVGDSTVVIAGSEVRGGDSAADDFGFGCVAGLGGDAYSGVDPIVIDSVVVGGVSPDLVTPLGLICPGGPSGTDFALGTPTFLAGDFLAVTAISPVRENTDLTIHLSDGPSDASAFLGVALVPQPLLVAALGGVLVGAGPYSVLALGALDAAGSLAASVPLSTLPPGLESAVFYAQFAYVDTAGTARLGDASAVTVLDDAIP